MDAIMDTLVNKDFALTEDSVDAVVYTKDTNAGDSETVTFLLDENLIMHQRYNKNDVMTFSEKVSAKDNRAIALMIASIK